MWVYDSDTKGMTYKCVDYQIKDVSKLIRIHRNTTFVPGLYKIFDEILVNAADNKVGDLRYFRFSCADGRGSAMILQWTQSKLLLIVKLV